jgi:hypothetical protein
VKKNIQPCKCGSTEFISSPNRYDVYEIVNGELELTATPFCYEGDDVKLYCRECGRELENAAELVKA